jgi:FkbM family methyltransferase
MMFLYKILYLLTIYFPLKIRDAFINFLALFLRRDFIITMVYSLLKEKSMMGVLPDGSIIFYPLDDFKLLPIISEIYIRKIYDTKCKRIEDFKFACDVGAHIGLFTLRMAKQVPDSKIIAIEPHPINFKFLVMNVFANGLNNRVQTLNAAAGRKKEKAFLLLSGLSRGDSSLKTWHDAGSRGQLKVDVLPLDDVLSCKKLCDLLKIDVEGAELEVFKGLENNYTKVKRIVAEIHIQLSVNPKFMIGCLLMDSQ